MERRETQLRCTNREFVFGDDVPFASCHASSLARTGGGFFAVWFGGTHEKHDDVAIWGARRDDAAEGWSAPRRIAKICDEAHWNPVLFAPPGSVRLHLFFKVGRSIADWVTWTMTSGDGGASWDAPRELAPGDRSGGRGPVKNKPIALSDGATWLAGASRERADRWDVFIDRSEDNGATWQATDLLPLDRT
jgi:predicted neuraminidase